MRSVSSNELKAVACVAMLGDHLADCVALSGSWAVLPLHCVGRISMPIFAFCLAEGYRHTHSFNRYFLRLLLFAVVSDLPFMLFSHNYSRHCVLWALLAGLVLIYCYSHFRIGWFVLVGVFVCVSCYFWCDWSFICPVLCLLLYLSRDSRVYVFLSLLFMSLAAIVVYRCWWQVFVLAAIFPLCLYSGQRGLRSRVVKWAFYVFYPAHFVALSLIG